MLVPFHADNNIVADCDTLVDAFTYSKRSSKRFENVNGEIDKKQQMVQRVSVMG